MNNDIIRNPFSIMFGKEPVQAVDRTKIINEICSVFSDEKPVQQMYLITGIRGSGKSAITGRIMKEFSGMKDWIVIDLNVEQPMREALLGRLAAISELKVLFSKAKLSFTAFGINASVEGKNVPVNVDAELDAALNILTRHGKRILITIDDVVSNSEMRSFAHFFQSCLMKDYDVFLLMNGIFENIDTLQNEKSLTFLLRAPKIQLEPLNLTAVSNLYGRVFRYPVETLNKMASITEGYPFAVQALGYICWNNAADKKNIKPDEYMQEFDYYLEDNVYDKLWSDMSDVDRDIITAVVNEDSNAADVKSIIQSSGISTSMVSNYKKRLLKKGIIKDVYGKFVLSLPRFGEFVKRQYEF